MLTLLPDASTTLVFYVNGNRVEEKAPDPEWTLLWYLRNKLRLVGSKLGCGEGGCGACTVMLSRMRGDSPRHYSVNACLFPVAALHGTAVTTIEALGSIKTRLHPLQERMAKSHGSQCGFCTPGFVMSAYALLRSLPRPPSVEEMEDALVGNLCRCTGYRPILEAFKTFTADGQQAGCGRNDCCKLKGDGMPNGVTPDLTVTDVMYDPTNFTPYDPSQELIFPPELKLGPEMVDQCLQFVGPRVTYYQVNNLEQLLKIKQTYPQAKLIVGNTELGVEVRLKGQLYPVLVSISSVPQLLAVEKRGDCVVVGAAVTLTDLKDKLQPIIEELPEEKSGVLVALVEMLRWFAGKQIRNVACLGGNIMTSSPISDINPILLAAKATLFLNSEEGGPRSVVMDGSFFTGYRQCAVLPGEVLVAVGIPYTQQGEYFQAFKQARRRDDDIAIVNAAFRVRFETGTAAVKDCSLSFGGVAAVTVLAERTMELLAGQQWDDPDIVQRATASLVLEVTVPPSAPGGMSAYRNTLVPSFFFKFYLRVRNALHRQHPAVVTPLAADEGEMPDTFRRPQNKATHFYQKVAPGQPLIDPVGRPVPHMSATQQVTGEAVYIDDLPRYSNELFGAVVVSTRAKAKIIRMDAEAALALEGVHSFVSAKDLPGDRNKTGPIFKDEEVFARDEVVCVGQILGLMLASDRKMARRAAKMVKVEYGEAGIPIITIEDAIAAKSYRPPVSIWTGDVVTGHQAADHTLAGEVRIAGQEHFYLEPNAHLAVPGEAGAMELFSCTQNPTGSQFAVAGALGVPASKVVVRVKRLGGGFGGKETRTTAVAVPAAVAAAITDRPVRVVLERDEDMLITGTRHPFLGRWKVSFTKEGKLVALEVDLYSNIGCSLDLSMSVMERALFSCDNAYKCPNVRVTGYACVTNLPSNTAFRGFGGPQGMFVMEDIMANVVDFLGVDPAKVRALNLYSEGEQTHFQQQLDGCTVRRCWTQVLEQARYEERSQAVQKYNGRNKYRKRGLAVVPTKYGISYTAAFLNQAGALVLIYKDGSVLLTHGGTEMGQGLHTKMIQIASRVFGIPCSMIHVAETATDKVPNTSPTAASASSDLNGEATLRACTTLQQRLEPYRRQAPKAGWQGWVGSAYMDRVQLSATGFYATPDVVSFNFQTQEGHPFGYFSYGSAVSEVEIDCLTGDHTVLRSDIVMDVGDSLNPAIDIGQVEGGFVQGLGLFTLEEPRYSYNGSLLTRGPGNYKIPGVQDIPIEFNVTLLRDSANPKAVYSSKAVGEPPLFLAGSVFFAVRDAVRAARTESGTSEAANTDTVTNGKAAVGDAITNGTNGEQSNSNTDNNDKKINKLFRFDSPATAERIRLACEDCFTRQIPTPAAGTFTPWDVTV